MKTLFVTSYHPHISRNIHSTDLFKFLLKDPDMRIVLLVPSYKVDYFRSHFAAPRIIIEGTKLYQSSRILRGLVFKKLSNFLVNSQNPWVKNKYQYYCTGKYVYYILGIAACALGKSFWIRRLARGLDFRLSPKGFYTDLFDRYRPAAVFLTDVQNENDVSIAHDARASGVRVIGMIRSWDNPTQRELRIFPDIMLAGSAAIRDEVVRIYRYPAERVFTVGQPHHDRYLAGPSMAREEFFAQWGFDADKPLVLYAPLGDVLIRHNDFDEYVMKTLAALDANILIRFPPDEDVRLPNFVKPSHMAYDKPGAVFNGREFGDRDIRTEDDELLMNELSLADVVVSGPTSIPLDAVLFDKPAIMVHFYPTKRGFCGSVFNYWLAHIQGILATGGIFCATSQEELLAIVRRSFEHPEVGAKERKFIRSRWFSHADGNAARRTADVLLSICTS